jgi:hypothetical protein
MGVTCELEAVVPVLPVAVVVTDPPELLLAPVAVGVRSNTVIVVVDDGEAIPLIDALRIGIGRLIFPVALVNDEVPLNGAKMSRLNGA